MKNTFRPLFLFLLSIVLVHCNSGVKSPQDADTRSFSDARKGFVTKLVKHNVMAEEAPAPPEELFSLVKYPTNIGDMVAYLGKVPRDEKLHPAIIWITGGFGNDIGDVWSEADPENDQTAAVFREAGIVMMYPAQRGGNKNPGYDESCLGEVDDILAAANFLARQPGIDSNRIYLGGHSTGGTKVLLAAECSKRFRAVFCFGPVESVDDYGADVITYNTSDAKEGALRSPALWLSSLQTPVYIFEGEAGNSSSLLALKKKAATEKNEYAHFYEVKGKTHFSVLQPVCKIAAQKILKDDQPGAVTMDFTNDVANIH